MIKAASDEWEQLKGRWCANGEGQMEEEVEERKTEAGRNWLILFLVDWRELEGVVRHWWSACRFTRPFHHYYRHNAAQYHTLSTTPLCWCHTTPSPHETPGDIIALTIHVLCIKHCTVLFYLKTPHFFFVVAVTTNIMQHYYTRYTTLQLTTLTRNQIVITDSNGHSTCTLFFLTSLCLVDDADLSPHVTEMEGWLHRHHNTTTTAIVTVTFST